MGNHPDKELVFVTASMAEILLSQNLVPETEAVIRQLQKSDPGNPRVQALAERLRQIKESPTVEQKTLSAAARDEISLRSEQAELAIRWGLTPEGLRLARAHARYSGRSIVRLFTAAPGPRGVRTGTRDTALQHDAGEMTIRGLPRPAVHVAAVGYLANTGLFVPLARSASLKVMP